MGLQSGINSAIGALGTAAALTDLNSSAKSTAKTVKELGVDAKMALKARNEVQERINAIRTNKELSDKARTNIVRMMHDPTVWSETVGQVMDDLNKAEGGTK